MWAGQGVARGRAGPPSPPGSNHLLRINNDLLMWEPADLLPAPVPSPAIHPPGLPGASGFWHDNFKMCKSAFKLGRRGVLLGPWDQGSPPPEGSFPLGSLISPQTRTRMMRTRSTSQQGHRVPPRPRPPSPWAVTPRAPSPPW